MLKRLEFNENILERLELKVQRKEKDIYIYIYIYSLKIS